ncbi:hypothetical protein OEA41_000283 [Lepraria neglecta]|uniref:Cytidyltransferase-like domain-containing protein n=1 Tax=Lepraria neglecta TaxID=209136 RepID=A0AAE0DPM7_9LECA|nr:hypothetical protein OEA41_000283 [Lepraria neglecta]
MAEANVPPFWLLLLPCPPSDVSLNNLRLAYGPGLSQALQNASKASAGASNVILDVAIAYDDNSTFTYSQVQTLFGLMYRLICVICTEQRIDLEYGNDVDARIILFHTAQDKPLPDGSLLQKSVIDLGTLASIDRVWQQVCSLESENAEALIQEFLRVRNGSAQRTISGHQVERLPGGLTIRGQPTQGINTQGTSFHRHRSVAVGGTFDHLHAGHKLLLTMAALILSPEPPQARCLTIGITGDELLKNKQYREELEDFPQRQSAVQHFLLDILELISPTNVLESTNNIQSAEHHGREVHNVLKSGLTINYVEIFDPCGPTITDEAIAALVLSGETRKGGEVVNEKRGEKGWATLEVFEVDVLDTGECEAGDEAQSDETFQSKISSTDIRRKVHQKKSGANGKT